MEESVKIEGKKVEEKAVGAKLFDGNPSNAGDGIGEKSEKESVVTRSTLGSRIRDQRKRLNMTQEELARRMCIPKCTISSYECNRIDIKASIIRDLAIVLYTRPDYLLGFSDYTEEELELIALNAIINSIEDDKKRAEKIKELKAIALI